MSYMIVLGLNSVEEEIIQILVQKEGLIEMEMMQGETIHAKNATSIF